MSEVVHVNEFLDHAKRPDRHHLGLPSLSIFGLGYVGAVSAACFAQRGATVCGVDPDASKTAIVQAGRSPIVEPGLDDLIHTGVGNNLLYVSASCSYAVLHSKVSMVCVGTPSLPDGSCDTKYLIKVSEQIGAALKHKDDFHVIVFRSTVPPGTTQDQLVPVIEETSGKKMGTGFGVAFNPEFLRECTAIDDFHNPPKTVIGASDPKTASIVASLYRGVDDDPIMTSIRVAEMVKYTDNNWHAVKVCFANEIGRLCKAMQIDGQDVMDIFVQDTTLNISSYYMRPGFAFGGSCLPKDVRGLTALAEHLDVRTPMLSHVVASNEAHVAHARAMIETSGPKGIALLGLTFKPGTDDLRESPMLTLLADLLEAGYTVKAYDPNVKGTATLKHYLLHAKMDDRKAQTIRTALPNILTSSVERALEGQDVVVISHATDEFRNVLLNQSSDRTIIDLARCARHVRTTHGYEGVCW